MLVMSLGILATIPASGEHEEFFGRAVHRHLDDAPRETEYFPQEGKPQFLVPTAPKRMRSPLSNLQPVVIDDSLAEFAGAELAAAEKQQPESIGSCSCGAAKPCPGVCRAPGYPEKPHRTMPGDRDHGDSPPYRYGLNDCIRAGNPHEVAPWAMPSITKGYSGWFVGGGAAFGGRGKGPQEGTWGLDYHGCLKPRRVWMKWTCGRYQGGEGAYAADNRGHLFSLE